MQRQSSTRIRKNEEGLPLLVFLCKRFTYQSGDQWEDDIAAGRILLNGDLPAPEITLSHGDRIEYRPVSAPEPPVDDNFSVVYEDHDLLVLNKPGNLPCHPAGRYFKHTLWHKLKFESKIDFLGFINRLDRETSGLVLVAKNKNAARNCNDQISRGAVSKYYHVLVEGRFTLQKICAAGILAPASSSPVRKKLKFKPAPSGSRPPARGKTCKTVFERIKTAENVSLLSAIPASGRTHQIRATLYSIGYPVVGDKIYGVDDTIYLRFIRDRITDIDRKRLKMGRQALHASEIRFQHPVRKTSLAFRAPMPEDMQRVIEAMPSGP
jgi:23S rRNA pseudouridine955/2504/2580 synthase/23S rRNA pseudouridine1911/1915/1917 synthase